MTVFDEEWWNPECHICQFLAHSEARLADPILSDEPCFVCGYLAAFHAAEHPHAGAWLDSACPSYTAKAELPTFYNELTAIERQLRS